PGPSVCRRLSPGPNWCAPSPRRWSVDAAATPQAARPERRRSRRFADGCPRAPTGAPRTRGGGALTVLLRRFVFHNFGLKVASLAAAVVLWGLIATEPELETTLSVPVEFHNVPKDLEVLSD